MCSMKAKRREDPGDHEKGLIKGSLFIDQRKERKTAEKLIGGQITEERKG